MKTAIWTYLFCPLNASLFGRKIYANLAVFILSMAP